MQGPTGQAASDDAAGDEWVTPRRRRRRKKAGAGTAQGQEDSQETAAGSAVQDVSLNKSLSFYNFFRCFLQEISYFFLFQYKFFFHLHFIIFSFS